MPANYNVAPTTPVLAVRHNPKTGERVLGPLHWGLIPPWAKDRKIAGRLTNARAETVDHLPSYRDAFRRHRCIVTLDGFYEWLPISPKVKQTYAFALDTRAAMGVAGLWSASRPPTTGAGSGKSPRIQRA